MEYDRFEAKFDRRGAALHLAGRVHEQLARGRVPSDGWLPDDAEVAALLDEWLPPHVYACQHQVGEPPCNREPEHCGRRCGAVYWRKHCEDVAGMLAAFARELGEPVRLWQVTGMIHDLDYPRYPHHDAAIASDRAHPVGISTQLFERGAPPLLVLALLSHAPHLRFRPESALGWAVLAADEHATMSGFGEVPEYHLSIDRRLTACLIPNGGELRGFHRNDMEGRANLALLQLTRVLRGEAAAEQLSASRWTPLDWDGEVEKHFPRAQHGDASQP